MPCRHFNAARKIAEEHGFHLHRRRKHLVWRNADGVQVVCAASPSDHHALANFRARLRRYTSA